MNNILYEPLRILLEQNKHSLYYNILVLKSSLNTLSFNHIITEEAPLTEVIELINTYKNQKELYEFVKLSTDSSVSFKDMLMPSLAEPLILFH